MRLLFFRLLLTLIFSSLVTSYLIPLIMQIAKRFGVLDVPDGAVKKHEKPIPYLGGVAIYLGFITTLAIFSSFENRIVLLLIGSSLLLFLGLIDDLVRMKHYQKFAGQFCAAFCFLKSGFYLKEAFFLNNLWSIPISLFWILSIINAFNLVDIMDGLAISLAIWATLAFVGFGLLLHEPTITLVLVAFLGSLCSFFWFNKPPAKIYLGDAGSLYIGGFLATIPFLLPWSRYNCWGFFAPVVILALPIFEVCSLIIIRTYKRIPFYNASPDHFALYLQAGGWSKKSILMLVCVISVMLTSLSFLLVCNIINLFSLIIISTLLLATWFFIIGYKSHLSQAS